MGATQRKPISTIGKPNRRLEIYSNRTYSSARDLRSRSWIWLLSLYLKKLSLKEYYKLSEHWQNNPENPLSGAIILISMIVLAQKTEYHTIYAQPETGIPNGCGTKVITSKG